MRRIVSPVIAAMLLAAAAQSATAQAVAKHQGFWIGFGLGGGWNLASNVGGESKPGGAAHVRLGGTLSQRWLLGGEVLAWAWTGDGPLGSDLTVGRGNVTLTAIYYASVQTGVFVKGGVGGATFTNSVKIDNTTTTTTDNGFGATLGVGWDIRLGRNLYLTPAVDFMYQRVSVGDETVNNTITTLTFGLTWH